HHTPEPPAEESGQFDPAKLNDGRIPADGSEIALMPVFERRRWWSSRRPRGDQTAHITAHLLGCRGNAGNSGLIHYRCRIANHKNFGVTGDRKVRSNSYSADPVMLSIQPPGRRRWRHAGSPDERAGFDAPAIEVDPARIAACDPRRCHDLNALSGKRPARI